MGFKDIICRLAELMSMENYNGDEFLATYKELENIILRNYKIGVEINEKQNR